MSKPKRIMAKGKVMDIKRETKSDRKDFVRKSDHSAVFVRKSDHSAVHNRSNVQTPDNMQDPQTTDNSDQEKTVGKRQNMKKVDPVFGFTRQTVIRNLPQLQKLDNVPVSSEEMVSC